MTTMGSPAAEPWRVETATADMRTRIRAGDFRQEDGSQGQLPTAGKLGEQYGLSRVSINRVIAKLRTEGLVETRSGKRGALVRRWNPVVFLPQQEFEAQTGPNADLLTRLVEAVAREGKSRIDDVTVQPAEERIRSRLGLRPGEHVGVRRRTSLVDGVPTLTDDSFAPLSLVDSSDWLRPGNVARGTNKVLAELGHELVRAVDELRPRYTTKEEDLRLGLGADGSVNAIELVSTGFDRHDMPVQVTVLTLPGPRNTVVYERHRPRMPEGKE
ncbi:GntR family transcriptional regulator [Streptomyces qinglanensis]|uniref:GntR family transcriptional regulator n=1 Tax=Streptomyces qinglanensis TaxID=943816 RepID=UPI003D74CF69